MKNKTLLLVGFLLILAVLFYRNDFDTNVAFLVLSAVIGYFVGAFSFIVSLPIASSVYGFIIVTISKIHYMLFTVLVKKTLKRSKVYRKTELKVKNTGIYKKSSATVNKVFKKTGVSELYKAKFVEVKNCRTCGRSIPRDGRFCPYCASKQ